MKKILVYSDSLFGNLTIPTSAIHVESFPGVTAKEAVDWMEDDDPRSVKSLIAEDNYDLVIICFGTNDVGYGENAAKVAEYVCKLIEAASTVNKVFVTLLNENLSTASKEFNLAIKNIAPKTVDFFYFFENIDDELLCDGLHLNKDGKTDLIGALLELL